MFILPLLGALCITDGPGEIGGRPYAPGFGLGGAPNPAPGPGVGGKCEYPAAGVGGALGPPYPFCGEPRGPNAPGLSPSPSPVLDGGAVPSAGVPGTSGVPAAERGGGPNALPGAGLAAANGLNGVPAYAGLPAYALAADIGVPTTLPLYGLPPSTTQPEPWRTTRPGPPGRAESWPPRHFDLAMPEEAASGTSASEVSGPVTASTARAPTLMA